MVRFYKKWLKKINIANANSLKDKIFIILTISRGHLLFSAGVFNCFFPFISIKSLIKFAKLIIKQLWCCWNISTKQFLVFCGYYITMIFYILLSMKINYNSISQCFIFEYCIYYSEQSFNTTQIFSNNSITHLPHPFG